MDKTLLSMDEFAAMIGVGEWTAKKLIREGAVLSVKIGDRRLVPVSAVKAYVDRLVAEAQGERVPA